MNSGKRQRTQAENIFTRHVTSELDYLRNMQIMTEHRMHSIRRFFGRHDWYYSDAYRTIANIGMDHLWFDADPWQTENANKLQQFYCEEQAEHWDGVFLTDGTRLEEKHFIRRQLLR